MRISAVRSLIVISLVTALVVAGTTMAWFTDEYNLPSAAEMVVGTLDFEITDASVIFIESDGEGEDDGELEDGEQSETLPWQAGECKEFSWTFRNTGSKAAFFRARPEGIFKQYTGNETAWGEGERIKEQGNWAMYFKYEGTEKTVRLMAGQHYEAGTVRVWEEGSKLYIRYETNGNWKLIETQLHIADNIADFLNGGGNPAPGQFDYKKEDHDLVGIYTEEIAPIPDYDPMYIATHAVVVGGTETAEYDKITWKLPESSAWKEGEDSDGTLWYYYCEPVKSGEEITLVLNGCLASDAAGGNYDVKLIAESVQASHGAAGEVWPSWPGGQ